MIRLNKATLVVIIFAIALIAWIAPGMGHYLVVEDPLVEADILIILMGSVAARVLEAADIYGAGYAREVLLVRSFAEAEDTLAERGLFIPGNADLTRDAAVQLGIPEIRITVLPGGAKSTRDEVLIVREYLFGNPEIETVILVTSSFHSRRTRAIFERFCGNLEREIIFISRASSYDSFQPEGWWRDRESAKQVLFEYLKLGHFYLWERWRL